MTVSNDNNGWAEYQKLVLAELERHNKWLNTIDEKLNATLLTFSVERKAVETLLKMVEQLDTRVDSLEKSRTTHDATAKVTAKNTAARKWVIGLSISTVISVTAIITEVITRAAFPH